MAGDVSSLPDIGAEIIGMELQIEQKQVNRQVSAAAVDKAWGIPVENANSLEKISPIPGTLLEKASHSPEARDTEGAVPDVKLEAWLTVSRIPASLWYLEYLHPSPTVPRLSVPIEGWGSVMISTASVSRNVLGKPGIVLTGRAETIIASSVDPEQLVQSAKVHGSQSSPQKAQDEACSARHRRGGVRPGAEETELDAGDYLSAARLAVAGAHPQAPPAPPLHPCSPSPPPPPPPAMFPPPQPHGSIPTPQNSARPSTPIPSTIPPAQRSPPAPVPQPYYSYYRPPAYPPYHPPPPPNGARGTPPVPSWPGYPPPPHHVPGYPPQIPPRVMSSLPVTTTNSTAPTSSLAGATNPAGLGYLK
ncbi:hypothetical protein NMY22_g7479 [Coprinellus aureogranulatus]|nr:hypothetical protein NMY22_g7479 [Coprinellus aureogranulatus]